MVAEPTLDRAPQPKPTIQYAGFWRRVAAAFIDSIILQLVGIGISFTFGRNPFDTTSTTFTAQLDYFVTFVVCISYVLYFWVKQHGQTPGKRALHIQVVREDGKPLDWGTAVIRYVSYFVSALPLGLGYVWVLFSGKKQAWHDSIARTYVVKVDEGKPSFFAYALGCVVPILFIIGMLIFFVIAGIMGYRQAEKQSHTSKSFTTSLKEMNPEAKQHFDRSQELFKQMRDNSTDPAAVKTLNDENIAELKKALEIEPDNARLWYDLGNAYTWVSSSGSLEEGLKAFQKAEELDPSNIVYINGVGDMLIRMGKNEDAILRFQQTFRLTDKSGFAHLSAAQAYQNLKIYDQATENYQKAIDIFTAENSDGSYDDEILQARKAMSTLPK